MRDEVDALGGVAREDDLARVDAALKNAADALARRLVGVGRPGAQLVHAAVDVRVDRRRSSREIASSTDSRLLRRRRVVEIDERLAVDRAREDREVGANALDVERRRCGPGARLIARRGDRSARHARGGRHAPSTSARSFASCSKSSASSASRSGSIWTPSSTWPANAWISMSRASAYGQAAGAQVEDRLVVELADRRAVRALHVVGEDLELRLGVDRRAVGQEQRAVRLLGVGLLRVLPDDDLAVEHRARRAAQDALVDLVAAAVRLRVVDRRVVVDQPVAVGEIEAVERAVAAFTVEEGGRVVADELAAERERVRREARAARGVHVQAGDVERLERLLLDLVVIDAGVLADEHLGDGVGEVGLARGADVALDEPRLAVRRPRPGACADAP